MLKERKPFAIRRRFSFFLRSDRDFAAMFEKTEGRTDKWLK